MELMALELRRGHHDPVRVAHADDRGLLDTVFLVQVVRGDRVSGLVVRDRALVERRHVQDRLLDPEDSGVTRGEPILVRERRTSVVVRHDERLVDYGLDLDRSPANRVRDHEVDRYLRFVCLHGQVVLDDVAATVTVRLVHVEPPVEPTGAHERGVEHVGSVRRAHHEHDRLRGHRPADDPQPAEHLVLHSILDVRAERVHLVEKRVEGEAAPAEHPHPAHAGLRLATLDAATGHADRIELVHKDDARAWLAGERVLARQTACLTEERHDDERVDTHPHASEARGVDVDERKVRLGRDDAGEEGLPGPRRPGEEHPFRHLTAA